MINDKVFLGFPLEFKDICKVYPPTVNDVSGNPNFRIYQSLFTITQEDLEDAYLGKDGYSNLKNIKVPTPFEYLMLNCYQDEKMKALVLEGFEKFIREPVTIEPEIEMLLIGVDEEHLDPNKDLDEPRLITKENYFDFQNMIRTVMGEEPIQPPDLTLHPKIREHKAKLRKAERLRAKKKTSTKFGTLLAAICCMGIGLNPLNIGEMSYACVSWLIAMEQQKESYDIDIRSLLAGADRKKVKPKYWIKNLDEKE